MQVGDHVFFLKNQDMNASDCWDVEGESKCPRGLALFHLKNRRTGESISLTKHEIEYNRIRH